MHERWRQSAKVKAVPRDDAPGNSAFRGLLMVVPNSYKQFEGWHDLSILAFPSDPPYFHLICRLHLICPSPSRISHLASCRSHLPHPRASRRHLEFRAVRICHHVHLVHLIYAIQANLGQASRPSHLASCHIKMKMKKWVSTSFPGRASPQKQSVPNQV